MSLKKYDARLLLIKKFMGNLSTYFTTFSNAYFKAFEYVLHCGNVIAEVDCSTFEHTSAGFLSMRGNFHVY